MNRRLLAVLLTSVFVIIAAVVFIGVRSRSTAHDCTLIGCQSAVSVDLTSLPQGVIETATNATFCANGQCESWVLRRGFSLVSVSIDERTVRSASLRLSSADGHEVANIELREPLDAVEHQPNGPDCEPTCWLLALTAADGALEPAKNGEAVPGGRGG